MHQSFKDKIQGRFISFQGIENLSSYKYSGEDESLIYNYFVNPLAKALCNGLPRTIAPNVLTLLGLLCSAGAYILGAIYIPTFTENAPSWVYYTAAALVFTYLILDAMDGTQARRTEMASPMGELFDHLCDSLSVTLCVMLISATMRLGAHEAFFLLIMFFIPFYSSHWVNYNTGKLEMGKFGGPTDLLVIESIALVITGIFGSEIWLKTFNIHGHDFAINHTAVIIIAAGSVFTTLQYVVTLVKQKDPLQGWGETLAQLSSYTMFLILCFGFLASPYILRMYSHEFMLCVGTTNAYLLARLIVVRVTKEPVRRFHIVLVFLFAALVISTVTLSPIFPWNKGKTPPTDSTLNYFVLGALLGYCFVQWLFFFGSVVRQLSAALLMPIFTVKKKKSPAEEQAPILQSQQTYGRATV